MVDAVNNLLGMGPSGRHTWFQSGLVIGSAGAVVQVSDRLFIRTPSLTEQALTMATSCAHVEWSTSELRSATLSEAVLVGQVAGAILWSAVADVLGRKEACCLSCVVLAASTAACGFSASFGLLRASCVAVGLGLPGATVYPVLLVLERTPARLRGRCVMSLGWFATFGSLAALCCHLAIEAAGARGPWSGSIGVASTPRWRTLCAVVALLPFGAGISASNKLAESIPWLVCKGRLSSARLTTEKAAVTNFSRSHRRVTDTLRALDGVLAAVDEGPPISVSGSWSLRHQVWNWTKRAVRSSCRAAAVCGWGLAFLVAFGYQSVVSLVRLELDANQDAKSSAFRRRLDTAGDCPGLDYSIVWSALASQALGIGLAVNAVDAVGRRPTLAALCAVAAAGLLVLAGPEYFPDLLDPPSRSALVAAMMTARAALAAAQGTVALLIAETRAPQHRATAAATAYLLAELGAHLSTYWVVSPNPVSTISLLVTLVNVSAAWAALAFPLEPNKKHIDALVHNHQETSLDRPAPKRPAYRFVGLVDLDDLGIAAAVPHKNPSETTPLLGSHTT